MTTDNKKSGKDNPEAVKKGRSKRFKKWMFALGATSALTAVAIFEYKTSYFESQYFHHVAKGKTVSDPECKTMPVAGGPYDEQLGYTHMLQFRDKLRQNFDVTCSPWKDRHVGPIHLFPIYSEKAQAGLTITDASDQAMYQARFPRDTYSTFDSIPPLLMNSLLFVENRALMDDHPETWNPAIEWDRFGKAVFERLTKTSGRAAGGSTLATQIEKFRHSPDGITSSGTEKLRQMFTASVRSYVDGSDTKESRRRIVQDYLNSMPLSSYPGFGTVNGYADGMAMWFGTDFRDASRLMTKPEAQMDDVELKDLAKVYRQSLALVMAVKKPSAFLQRERTELEARIDWFLPKMVEAKLISPRLMEAVKAERLVFADPNRPNKVAPPPKQKSVQALQVDLMRMLGVRSLYDLNRVDVTAHTTLNLKADAAVAARLRSLADPEVAKAAGMVGYQLLPEGGTAEVIYTFTLYERLPDGRNVQRVQADNYDGALNFNDGGKLELGSTSKLRTLVSYLNIMSELHKNYANRDPAELSAITVLPEDRLTRWALDYLAAPGNDKSLTGMLEAALDRQYSGSSSETFFTAGGAHRFANFERGEEGMYTVKKAFHKSVNLAFIRITRDIENYMLSQKMHVDPAIFTDPANPQRIAYLQKFVDMEGRGFMWKFWGEQKDKGPAELAEILAEKTHRSPVQLAVVYRSLFPDAPLANMESFIRKECKDCSDKTDFQALYDKYGKDKFDLNDRGYITSIHPLALWMAENRIKTPDMTWEQTATASTDVRRETYKWLFKDGKERGQNLRIKTMLEQEAFEYIHKDWQAMGYPFAKLVPSYATGAMGVSGDTPAALAELAGIIQNDGIRKPVTKFTSIEIGKNTPYETTATPHEAPGVRVLPEEVTKLVRREMIGVVEEGTGVRLRNAVILSDGTVLPVGVKTGTGDNRKQTFSARGGVTSEEKKSRTATVDYVIGDRYWGTATANIIGPNAKNFKFTSALAAQLLKSVVPDIRPVLDAGQGVNPDAPKPQPPKAVQGSKPAA
ncbi:MAG: transglycosylase domain-containing protein [Alphaproteobacteria bacterium]